MRHEIRRRNRPPLLLSSGRVNAAGDSPRKHTSNAVTGLFMVTRTSLKSWGGTTCVRAARDCAFKKCCMLSGEFDGSRRNYFFQSIDRFAGSRRLCALAGCRAESRVESQVSSAAADETWGTRRCDRSGSGLESVTWRPDCHAGRPPPWGWNRWLPRGSRMCGP